MIVSSFIARTLAPRNTISAWHLRPPHSHHYYDTVTHWKQYVVTHKKFSDEIEVALNRIGQKPVHSFIPKHLAISHFKKVVSTVKKDSEKDREAEIEIFSSPIRRTTSGRFSLYVSKGSTISIEGVTYKVHTSSNSERLIPYSGKGVKRFSGPDVVKMISSYLKSKKNIPFEDWLNRQNPCSQQRVKDESGPISQSNRVKK